ncbi:SGNH/GDSL hydrolase family protein [Arthrobacter sp. zg-Y895]|uniref:SGNH/GDSL hydrolase family protein n=1 Tax=Arthrobacter sp. zg-Y895 TaxID=2886933 RepID=UPI001D137E65|nr:SGNH/GDSL hydrolase family protein [Arthrobacter sp. zg-Y895]
MITAEGKQVERIVVAGDSIAYGRGDGCGTGWAGMLQKAHLARNPEQHRYFNLSIPGIGTAEMSRIVRTEIQFRTPDLVILSYGINDSRRIGSPDGPRPATPEQVADGFAANVEHLRTMGAAVCAVGLIPPDTSRTTPIFGDYFDAEPAREVEMHLAKTCGGLGVPRVLLWDLFTDAPERLTDGLHPDAEGHAAIFRRLQETLTRKPGDVTCRSQRPVR